MSTKTKSLPACLLLWLSFLAVSPAALAEDIVVSDAWIREAPPGAHTLAGYARISNKSSQDIMLLGVDSDVFGMIMLHQTRMDEHHNMTMHHMDGVKIPAKSFVELKPGAIHIMLMRPARDYRAGDKVILKLNFSGNVSRQVSFVVTRK